MKLSFEKGLLTVASASQELGEGTETLDVAFDGEPLSIGLNAYPTATHGDQTTVNAPTARAIRSSVGPNPRNDMRKTPAAWVARYDSAVSSRYAPSRITATVGS